MVKKNPPWCFTPEAGTDNLVVTQQIGPWVKIATFVVQTQEKSVKRKKIEAEAFELWQ